MDLTQILPGFFQSGINSITEYKKLLKETAAQEAWVSAVKLYRAGMSKIQNKDLTGMEEIRKANEALKIIVKDYDNNGNLKTPMEQLAESIEKFDDTKVIIMETAFKGITENLTKNGFKVIEEDAVLPPQPIEAKAEEKPVPTSELPPAPATTTEEKHPYEIGFEGQAVSDYPGSALARPGAARLVYTRVSAAICQGCRLRSVVLPFAGTSAQNPPPDYPPECGYT